MNELQKIESFRYQLAIAETFEEISLLGSVADAMAEFAKKEKVSLEKQNEIGLYRIEVMEKMGEWLDGNFPSKERIGNTNALKNAGNLSEPAFSKMPVSKKESVKSRIISRAEPELKEKVINDILSKGDVITPYKVATELKREIKIEERKSEIQKIKDKLKSEPLNPITDKFDIVVLDPPDRDWETL